jgi:hypothetical protein
MTLFGAIDEAATGGMHGGVGGFGAESGGERVQRALKLLPAYRHGVAGWFGGLMRAARRAPDFAAARARGDFSASALAAVGLPTLPEALANLARPPAAPVAEARVTTGGRARTEGAGAEEAGSAGFALHLATRRLLAIAVLSRLRIASPVFLASPLAVSDDELSGVLVPIVAGGDSAEALEDRARALLALLADERTYPDLQSWPSLLRDALAQGLLSTQVARQVIAPLTCAVFPSCGQTGPAVAFETRMLIHGASLTQVTPILDQNKWTDFLPPWCNMTAVPPPPAPPPDICLEIVSIDCAMAPGGLSIRSVLDFQKNSLPVPGNNPAAGSPGGVLEYRLDPNQSLGGDGQATVDEGSLVVKDLGGNVVEVLTTKRIQFAALSWMSSLEAAWLAHLVWVLGYCSIAEYFVNAVAGTNNWQVQVLGGSDTGVFVLDAGGPCPPCTSATTTDQLAGAVHGALSECFEAKCTSFGKMAAGQYGPASYLSDLATFSSHISRQGANVLRLVSASLGSRHGARPGSA